VTNAQRQNPTMRTTVINNNNTTIIRNKTVVVHSYNDSMYGPGWYGNPYGFYSGDSFWQGYMWGSMMSHDYAVQPVYVYSPVSQVQMAPIQPPAGGFQNEQGVQMAVLGVMSQGDPSNTDPNSGLYVNTDNFDPNDPGPKISAQNAYNTLANGGSVYFHPPNGAYEKIGSFNDLQSYTYSKEAKSQAPQQQVIAKAAPSKSHTLRNVLIGGAVVGGVAAGAYWLYQKKKKDDW